MCWLSYTYDPITWEVEAGGKAIAGCFWLLSKLEANPGYMRPYINFFINMFWHCMWILLYIFFNWFMYIY